jgi:hypothetical protein
MNAVTQPAFAHLLPAERFTAWRILSDGTSQPLDTGDATTLHDAANNALQGCSHKDHFTVLHTNVAGKQTEHVYYVKASKPIWVRKPGFAHSVQVRPLALDHRFSRKLAEFVPVEPWHWSPGCDVVGVDRNVVEARNV